jgi:hypothetical protein
LQRGRLEFSIQNGSFLRQEPHLILITVYLDSSYQISERRNFCVALSIEHVETALAADTTMVFLFRAWENQRNWMNRYMKKPPDLSAALTVSGLTRLNNYLPFFPGGSIASTISESELVAILEFSITSSWRKRWTCGARHCRSIEEDARQRVGAD